MSIATLSVITVVYNSLGELEKTLESLRKQDLAGIEWVVVDGGSTDGSLELIESVTDIEIKWISEKDNGIYDAMNKAIDLSTGKYLQFLNAGDIYHADDTLSEVIPILEGSTFGIVFGAFEIWGKTVAEKIFHKAPRDFTLENLKKFGTGVCNHQAFFILRSITPKYSNQYKLKGELNWYIDIASQNPPVTAKKLDQLTIVNYELGGAGNINYRQNLYEWIQVTRRRFGLMQVIKSWRTYRNFIRYSKSMNRYYS